MNTILIYSKILMSRLHYHPDFSKANSFLEALIPLRSLKISIIWHKSYILGARNKKILIFKYRITMSSSITNRVKCQQKDYHSPKLHKAFMRVNYSHSLCHLKTQKISHLNKIGKSFLQILKKRRFQCLPKGNSQTLM
jgi:hypothetical protein